jgi:anti-sigma factor RsiW
MSCCPAFEPLLLERSSGTIHDADASRLEVHLRACPACRAEAAAFDDVVAMVTLPEPSDLDRAALSGLADSVRSEWRRAQHRSLWSLRGGAWLAAGTAVAAALIAATYPPVQQRSPRRLVEASSSASLPAWQEPDPDELLEAVDFDDDGADAAVGADELALASATADDLADP